MQNSVKRYLFKQHIALKMQGPHSSPEKHFLEINKLELSFDYTSRLIKSPYYLCLQKGLAIPLNKFESPLSKDALCQSWVKSAQWFFKCRQCTYFCYMYFHFLPLEKCLALHMNKLESPSPKTLCEVWLKMTHRFWRKSLNIINALLLFLF